MNAPVRTTGEEPVLDISVERSADGSSRLVRRRVSYPWSLGRGYPSRSGSRAITIIPQAAGGGLLAGDCFRQHIAVTSGASLRVVPAGATLVHGTPSSKAGRSFWRYELEASATASIASEPYVLMEDAHLEMRQDLVVDLEAVLVAAEAVVIAPGISRASWMMETRAMRPDGTRIFNDVQAATTGRLRRIGRLPASFTAFATVLIFAPSALLKDLCQELEHLIARTGSAVWVGCAPLRAEAGLGIRIAASEGGQIRKLVRELQEFSETSLGI